MIDETVKAFGALHVMVANAGIAQVAPALEVSEEDVSRMFNVNFMGVWNCYTLAGKQMIKQGAVSFLHPRQISRLGQRIGGCTYRC